MAKKTSTVKTCRLCGTPLLTDREHAVVLYFATDHDRREFVKVVHSAVPNVHTEQLDHGRLHQFEHDHDH